jgi:hypothetical protein
MSSTFSPFNSQFGGSLPSFGGGARGFSFRQTTRLNDQSHENAMAILDKLHEHALAEGAQGHTNMENLTRMQHFHDANESAKSHAATQTLQDTMAAHQAGENAFERTHLETMEGLRGTNEVARIRAEGSRERAARRGEAAAHTVETDNEIRKNKKASKQSRKTQQQTHQETLAESAQEHTQRLEAERQAPKTMTRMTAGSSITTTGPKGTSTTISKGAATPKPPAKKTTTKPPAKKTAPKPRPKP